MAKIKKGDTVIIIAGKDKGKTGTVATVLESGKRLLVEGVNLVKKHMRPNPNANQEGGIVTREAPIHHSNVMIYNPATKKGDRVKFKFIESGDRQKKVRTFASNGEMIDIT
ncbi:MAG: 50S ribosomal protein L24 [Gammaproteobacteria bacterium]